MKKIVIFVSIILLVILFFFPKPSSSYPTEFYLKGLIRSGLSEEEASKKAGKEVIQCKCLGIEYPDKITSYSTQMVCFGVPLCAKTWNNIYCRFCRLANPGCFSCCDKYDYCP